MAAAAAAAAGLLTVQLRLGCFEGSRAVDLSLHHCRDDGVTDDVDRGAASVHEPIDGEENSEGGLELVHVDTLRDTTEVDDHPDEDLRAHPADKYHVHARESS